MREAYHGGGADWSEGITLEEIGQSAASLVTGEPPAYVLQVLNDGSGRRVRQTVRNIERRLRVDPGFAAAPLCAALADGGEAAFGAETGSGTMLSSEEAQAD